MFANLVEQKVEWIGSNAKELDFNVEHRVFKLHLHCRAKLYENYENLDYEFPFEWQFLNLQIPYKLRRYICIHMAQFIKLGSSGWS